MRALWCAKKGARGESPGRWRGGSNPASCRGESGEPPGRRRRELSVFQVERVARAVPCGPHRRGPVFRGDSDDQAALRGPRHHGVSEFRGEMVEAGARYGRRRHGEGVKTGAERDGAQHPRNRLGQRHDEASGRREPWRSSVVRRERHLAQVRRRDCWHDPDEERSSARAPAADRLSCGAVRPSRAGPEGFGEREESMRPRASLPGSKLTTRQMQRDERSRGVASQVPHLRLSGPTAQSPWKKGAYRLVSLARETPRARNEAITLVALTEVEAIFAGRALESKNASWR